MDTSDNARGRVPSQLELPDPDLQRRQLTAFNEWAIKFRTCGPATVVEAYPQGFRAFVVTVLPGR